MGGTDTVPLDSHWMFGLKIHLLTQLQGATVAVLGGERVVQRFGGSRCVCTCVVGWVWAG